MMTSNPAPPITAFVAPTNNTGRTSIVANLARVLSASGRRVLVLDWGTEGALIHDYLRPFQIDDLPVRNTLGTDLASALHQIGGGANGVMLMPRLRRYASGPGRLDVVGVTDPLDARRIGSADEPDLAGMVRLRACLQATGYDYVLIDSPTGRSGAGVAETANVADQIVVCFTTQSNVINSAARLAHDVRNQADRGLQTIIVASQVAEDDPARADRSLGDISRRFQEFLTEPSAPPVVRIPLQPYDEVLATVWEDPTSNSRLLRAYRHLAQAVTGDAQVVLPPVPATLRQRYRSIVSGAGAAARDRVLLACASADRWWAEFVRDQLSPNGIKTDWLAADALPDASVPRAFVVIASARWTESAAPEALRAVLAGSTGSDPLEVVVVLSDGTVPVELDPTAIVDLTDSPTAMTAAERLFGALGIRGVAHPGAYRGRLAAPDDLLDQPTTRTNALPLRDRWYFGRDDELSALRDRLLARDGIAAVYVTGEAGVGKTALIREYVHCFARDYETVWWISAHDRRSVHEALIELGTALEITPEGDMITASLRELANPLGGAGRWLLIYDDVEDLTDLYGAMPAGGPGHVIVTTRVGEPAAADGTAGLPNTAESMTVAPLRRTEAVAGLRKLVADPAGNPLDLPDTQAGELVDAVGQLPVALRLAGVYLTQKMASARPAVDPGPLDAGDPVAAIAQNTISTFLTTAAGERRTYSVPDLLNAVAGLLEKDPYGPRALRLAEMCSFLAPDGVSLALIHSPAWRAQLAAAAQKSRHTDVTEDDVDRILWTGARHGLFTVRWSESQPVRIPPVLRRLLQDRMAPRDRVERRAQVQRALAGYARSAPPTVPARAELQRHLLPSDAHCSTEWEVRAFVVRQFSDLFSTGDPANHRYAVPLVSDTLERWRTGPTGRDRLTLLLAIQRSNLHRALGEYRQALALDEEIHRAFAPRLGRDHLRILVLRSGLAGSLRALGRFGEALALDQATWRMFADTLGEDHPNTLVAAHNLAISLFLSGAVETALSQEQATHARRRLIFGPDGRPTLWSATDIGIYLRELGRFRDAARLLTDTEGRLTELGMEAQHPHRLRVRRHLAITRRLAGSAGVNPATAAQVTAAYRSIYGRDHPLVWANTLSWAMDCLAAGDSAPAINLASETLAYYRDALGADHPFTAICGFTLATILASTGEPELAVPRAHDAVDRLIATLGEAHPWTIAALINRVGVLAAAGQTPAAAEAAEPALALCLEFLGRAHPYTKVAWRSAELLREPDAAPHGHRFIDLTIPET